ncbi:MAG: hypothetical protein U9Q75_09370 [Pseudomonadota bacterium]|nr:hypothetical protein [Pseudomonadota bacterium]
MKTKRFLKCFVGLAAVSLLSPLSAEPDKEAQPVERSVTVIDHAENYRDAWVGYSDGTVQYCLGGGESAGPTWASCAEAGNIPDVAVTAIAADGKFREAWVGFANGALYRCKGGADLQVPWTSCNKTPVTVAEKK